MGVRGERNVHAIEVNGTNEARARGALQRRLRLALELERKAHDEVERLLAIAEEQDWTITEIAAMIGGPHSPEDAEPDGEWWADGQHHG